MKKFIFILVLFIVNLDNTYAWNSLGHKLVAQIACDNMHANSRKLLNKYNELLNTKGRRYSLINASIWLDTLYSEKYKDFRSLHFIDLPLIVDNVHPPQLSSYNAIFAINITQSLLRNKQASALDKAIAFRVLWHVVADLHQPMHAISRYSKKYPHGDRGGNLELLPKNKVAKNLHAYWDRGGGILLSNKPNKQVKKLAEVILKKWPCDVETVNLDPKVWAKESYAIAANFAYNFTIDSGYQHKVQQLSLKRIAQAGCRLAAISNSFNDF